jgi:hypothetical protein
MLSCPRSQNRVGRKSAFSKRMINEYETKIIQSIGGVFQLASTSQATRCSNIWRLYIKISFLSGILMINSWYVHPTGSAVSTPDGD